MLSTGVRPTSDEAVGLLMTKTGNEFCFPLALSSLFPLNFCFFNNGLRFLLCKREAFIPQSLKLEQEESFPEELCCRRLDVLSSLSVAA